MKKNKIIIAIIIFITMFIILSPQIYNNIQYSYDKGGLNTPIGEINKGTEIKYDFLSKYNNMSSIKVLFATFNRKNNGNIIVDLIDENNNTVFSNKVNVENLQDNQYKLFKFSKIKDSANHKYTLEIKAQDTTMGKSPTIMITNTNNNGKTYLNGKLVKGNINIITQHKYISFTKIIIFIIIDLGIFSYICFALVFSLKKSNETLYKYRYLIFLFLFCVSVSLKLNFSSIPVWNTYISSDKSNVYQEDTLFGKPRALRSDEWLVQTPMFLAQSLNTTQSYPLYNTNLSTEGTNMILSSYSPVKDILTIGKPFNWGFLLLGKDYGFSWYWISKVLLLFAFSFEFCMILTKKNRKISLFGAGIILFSSATQWWLSTSVVDLIVCSQIIMVSLNWYMHCKKYLLKFLCAIGIIVGGAGFIFSLYPPIQIPLGILILIFLIYTFKQDEKYKKLTIFDYFICLSIIIVLGSFIIHFYKVSYEQIKLIGNTVYPGKRISVGGGVPVESLLYYLFSWLIPFKDITTFSNNCDVSSFISLFPFIPGVFLFVNKKIYKEFRFLKYLIWFSVFQLIWMLFTFPKWFAKITLLSYVTSERLEIVFGLTCIYILVILLANIKEIKYRWSINKMLTILDIFFIIVIFKSNIYLYLGLYLTVFTLIYINLIIYYLLKKNQNMAIILIGIFVFVSGAFVNPIVKGLGSMYNNNLSKEIRQINNVSSGTWVGANGLVYGDYLITNGVKSYNCVNYYPDFDKWNKLDRSGKFNNIYNRYAHIEVDFTYDKTNFILNQKDFFSVELNYDDLINKTEIDYIMSKGKIDPKEKYKVFKELYFDKQSNIYLYKISRDKK